MALLRQRRREPEIMDQPDLSPDEHRRALAGLSRINLLSASSRVYFRPLLELQRRLGADRLRVLDVACGGGDVARRLWVKAADLGLDWRVAGCDLSPVAVEYAREQALRAGAPVHFFVHDALAGPLPVGPYDAVLCSLFLHHLEEDQAVALLRRMAFPPEESGPRLVLVNDLDRRLWGMLLAQVVPRLLTTSRVVHTDGVRSVRAAWTAAEALALAGKAGLAGATVRRRWPARWLLSWSRP